MWMKRQTVLGLAIAIGGLLSATRAEATDREWLAHGRSAEVEIDSLDASACFDAGHARVGVRYEVEIEKAGRGGAFELILSLHEDGRLLVDEFGQPVATVISLTLPYRMKKDDIEFRGRAMLRMPLIDAFDGRISVLAEVVRVPDGRVIDRSRTDVDVKGFRSLPRERVRGLGVEREFRQVERIELIRRY